VVEHALRMAAASAAALPGCWATLREPVLLRLARAAGLILAPGAWCEAACATPPSELNIARQAGAGHVAGRI